MKFDMHVHSLFSPDGRSEPVRILETAASMGLGGLCIADHNTMEGSDLARKVAGDYDLILIRGMEVSSSEGHILAYGISEPVPRGLGPAETVERIHEQGGIAVVAHPYRPWSGLGEEATRQLKPDAIEVLNSHSTARENARAEKLRRSMGLPGTAGSDSHELASVGRAYLTVPGHVESEEDVLEAVRRGTARPGGQSRSGMGALRDRTDTVLQWARRGFKKM